MFNLLNSTLNLCMLKYVYFAGFSVTRLFLMDIIAIIRFSEILSYFKPQTTGIVLLEVIHQVVLKSGDAMIQPEKGGSRCSIPESRFRKTLSSACVSDLPTG